MLSDQERLYDRVAAEKHDRRVAWVSGGLAVAGLATAALVEKYGFPGLQIHIHNRSFLEDLTVIPRAGGTGRAWIESVGTFVSIGASSVFINKVTGEG